MKRFFPGSWNRIVPAGAALTAAIALLAPCAAQATPYVVKLIQKGNNVVALGNGAIDLTGLTYKSGGWVVSSDDVDPSIGDLSMGSVGSPGVLYQGMSGPTSFGSGGLSNATSSSGGDLEIFGSAGSYPCCSITGPAMWVPADYVSDTPMSNSATWDSANAASLGVTPGIYTWTWGAGTDQRFILEAFTSVPEPAALGMLGFGLLLVGGFVRLRPRQPGSA